VFAFAPGFGVTHRFRLDLPDARVKGRCMAPGQSGGTVLVCEPVPLVLAGARAQPYPKGNL